MLTIHFDKVTIVFNTSQIKISSPETVDSIYLLNLLVTIPGKSFSSFTGTHVLK